MLSEGFKHAVAVGSSLGQGGPSPIAFSWKDIEDQFSPDLWLRIEKATNSLPIHAMAPCLYVKWGHDDERDFPELPSELTVQSSIEDGEWNLIHCDKAVLVQPIPEAGAGPVMFWFGPVSWTNTESVADKVIKELEGYDREPLDGSEPDSHYTNQDRA